MPSLAARGNQVLSEMCVKTMHVASTSLASKDLAVLEFLSGPLSARWSSDYPGPCDSASSVQSRISSRWQQSKMMEGTRVPEWVLGTKLYYYPRFLTLFLCILYSFSHSILRFLCFSIWSFTLANTAPNTKEDNQSNRKKARRKLSLRRLLKIKK